MERSRRFESNEAQIVSVPELASMNPHIATGKRFRCKILIEGIQPSQNWWFLAGDSCGWKSIEEGAAYRCSNEKCGAKAAGPRYRLPLVAPGDGVPVLPFYDIPLVGYHAYEVVYVDIYLILIKQKDGLL